MKVKLDFIGQCHNPNAVRGIEVTDRIEVVLNETTYNYSIDSDKEEVAKHALELHYPGQMIEEDEVYNVRAQLGLSPEIVEDLDYKTPAPKAKKTAKKKTTKSKSKLKTSSRKSK